MELEYWVQMMTGASEIKCMKITVAYIGLMSDHKLNRYILEV
jgi:hypothetical protein